MKLPCAGLRVGLLIERFRPEESVTGLQIVKGLIGNGATVRIITGTLSTSAGGRAPGAPLLSARTESPRGYEIQRLPYWPVYDKSALRRIRTYASFAASTTVAAPRAFRGLDVLLVYGSPATAAAAAMVWTRALRIPYVLHVQDVWPDSVFATGFLTGRSSRLAQAGLAAYMRAVYERAAAIVTISPGVRDLLLDRGVPAEKLHAIYNWTDEARFAPLDPVPHPGRVLMYAGTLGLAQDLDTLLSAAKLLKTPDARVLLLGSGPAQDRLRGRASAEGLANVEFVGQLNPERTREAMRAADLHLVSLADAPLFQVTIPSKVQSLLASGVPIVASVPGEAGRLVERAGAGVAVAPGDPPALARAVDRPLALPDRDLHEMGARGAAFYREYCSAKKGSDALARVLAASVGRDQGPPT
jgi:glycosyltransferase involved in cell wall biosynthesis